jgi:DNA-binding transcriptional MerR regulator
MINNIPKKRYYSIGEVCEYCKIKPYTLRYWEKKTNIISPVRLGSNRRYYTQKDIEKILKLSSLIHESKYSIDDAAEIMESDIASAMQYHALFNQINVILCEE